MTLDPLHCLQYLVANCTACLFSGPWNNKRIYITSIVISRSFFYSIPMLYTSYLMIGKNICVKSSMKYLQNWNFRSTYHAYLDATKTIRPKNTSKLVLVKTGHINIVYNTSIKMFRDHLVGAQVVYVYLLHNRHTPG